MSEKTPGFGLFAAVPLYVDKPMNEDNPHWNVFRLSLAKMKQVRSRLSHWSFQLDGLVLRDYARATITVFDPIDFEGNKICKRVEYVNVRVDNCSDCDVAWWQYDGVMLHHDSSSAQCGFDASSGAVVTEDDGVFTVPVILLFDALTPGENPLQTTGLVRSWNEH